MIKHKRFLGLVMCLVLSVASAACGDDASPTSSPSSTTTPQTTSTSATTTSSTTEAPTTSVPPSTTSTSSVPVVTVAAGDELGVAMVHKRDPDGGLLLQPTAAAGSSPLAVIPPNGVGLFATGMTATDTAGGLWFEVDYPSAGLTGWVHSAFVVKVPSFGALPCSTDLGDYGFDAASIAPPIAPAPVAGGTVATLVYALHHMSNPDCERTVVTFGADVGGDQVPASNLPASGGASLPLPGSFPGLISLDFGADVPRALPTALELFASQNGVVDAFVTRHPATLSRISLDMKFAGNRAIRVRWHTAPLQLVIDSVGGPTGTGMDLAALVSDLAAVMQPIMWDLNGPSPTPPIVISGWARPFEAALQVRLRQVPGAGAMPGTGAPVTANWSGQVGAAPQVWVGESSVFFDTTDYAEAWGWFEFSIDSLAPGTYELFVGDFAGEDAEESGVYQVFTVGW